MRGHKIRVPVTRPLILTLEFDPATFAFMDRLRVEYFPPERNFIPAHVSLFHVLPAKERSTIEQILGAVAEETFEFAIELNSVFPLGAGFAVRAESSPLLELRRNLAVAFASWLTPQDRQPFHPHVTLMNKSTPELAKAARARFEAWWVPRVATATGLALWTYRGGPWQFERRFTFQPIGS